MNSSNGRQQLSAAELVVVGRVLEEERREHLVVYLSGAHAYGFPSPDSDIDMKAVHIEKAERLLGLSMPALTFDRAEIIDGVEIDYTSNEISNVLWGFLPAMGTFWSGCSAPPRCSSTRF